MSKTMKLWFIIATLLVVVGLIMFTVVMSQGQWNFAKLSTRHYETNTYEINDKFNNISMNTGTANIVFMLSDNGKCKVECYEDEKLKHSVNVSKDTLSINVVDNRSWYDYIGINIVSPKVTVYLPKAEYTALHINEETGNIELPKDLKFKSVDISSSTGNINYFSTALEMTKIKTSTGNICIENTSSKTLDLTTTTGNITVSDVICKGNTNIEVSTGRTKLNNLKCKNLISSGSTGNMSLTNVIASEKFSINRSTGDVRFDSSDATEIFVKTSTGKVEGSLLTNKVFITDSSTGNINVPKTTSGGKCEIITSTGNIKIDVR